jgi:hypothetical protein
MRFLKADDLVRAASRIASEAVTDAVDSCCDGTHIDSGGRASYLDEPEDHVAVALARAA